MLYTYRYVWIFLFVGKEGKYFLKENYLKHFSTENLQSLCDDITLPF